MAARASHSHASPDTYWDFQSYDDRERQEFLAGEPICAPRARRGSTMLPAAIAIVMLFSGGFAVLETKAVWEQWLPTDFAAISSLIVSSAQGPANHKATVDASPPLQQPLVSREITEAPGTEAGTPMPPTAAANIPPATTPNETAPDATASDETASDETPSAPLPPPTVDTSDPYQTRALAAGLHPDLSRVLLTRMSAADYRNAGVAIKTALAETRDGDVFVWPRGRGPKDALFEVRFVKSAARDCRRYVVTITKDRWSTTAQPMEKCGLNAPGRRSS